MARQGHHQPPPGGAAAAGPPPRVPQRTPPGTLAVTRGEDLDRVIALALACDAGHLAPLLRAARAGMVGVFFVPPGPHAALLRADLRRAGTGGRGVCVVLQGDAAPPHPGPADFPDAARLARWARAVCVHAAGGEPWHYAGVAEAARATGRALLIETTTAREAEWCAFVLSASPPGTPRLHIRARGPHPLPCPPPGATVQ